MSYLIRAKKGENENVEDEMRKRRMRRYVCFIFKEDNHNTALKAHFHITCMDRVTRELLIVPPVLQECSLDGRGSHFVHHSIMPRAFCQT